MEHEERFERIEAAQERTAESLAYLYTIVGKIGEGTKALLTAQVLMVDAQTKADDRIAKLAEAQARTDEHLAKLAADHVDTNADLHLLYRIVDNWIREHGRKNGSPEPPPPS